MYVCICHGVTTHDLATVARQLPETMSAAQCVSTLMAETGAGTCCGSCIPSLIQLCTETLPDKE